MIDIHTHILPGIDDGSPTFETSVELLKKEIENGVTTVIATPHYCPRRGFTATKAEIIAAYEQFCEKLDKLSLPITVLLGQEIYLSDYDDIVKKIENGELLTLNGTKTVLIEFSMTEQPESLMEAVYNLNIKGYTVVIAHIERYRWMTLDIARELKNEGCLLHINASSYFSLKYRKFCRELIKNNLIDAVASDIHNKRTVSIRKIGDILSPSYFNGLGIVK